ncbi:MAG: DUF4149 domain-containing protein [Gemmatimonadaceae bacterium]
MSDAAERRGLTVAQLVVASVWLGATLLFIAVVAPAAFSALPSRTLAGALVGAVLPSLFYSGIVVGLVLALAAMAVKRRKIVTAGTVGGFLVAVSCAAAQFVVAPRIERVRAAISGPVESIPPTDPRRIAFGRLHGASVIWLGIATIGAVIVAAGAGASLRRSA